MIEIDFECVCIYIYVLIENWVCLIDNYMYKYTDIDCVCTSEL